MCINKRPLQDMEMWQNRYLNNLNESRIELKFNISGNYC